MSAVHLQKNKPGGTFAKSACGLINIARNVDIRPPMAFAVSVPRIRCKRCEATFRKGQREAERG